MFLFFALVQEIASCLSSGSSYAIRSSYVHGSLLSGKRRKKLLKDFGSVDNFLRTYLDCVRATLIVSVLMSKEKSKKTVIDLLDKALVDQKSRNELVEVLDPPKVILQKCIWQELPGMVEKEPPILQKG